MEKANYTIDFKVINNLFKITDLKFPRLLEEEDKKNVIDLLLQIVNVQSGELGFIKRLKVRDHYSDYECVFKVTPHKEIEFNVYKINTKTSKRRILFKRMFVIKPEAHVSDEVIKSIDDMFIRGNLSSAIYARLTNNYSALDVSIRNKVISTCYSEGFTSLTLELHNGVNIILPVKGVMMIKVAIKQPDYIEFNIKQKFLPTLHVALQGHI